MTAILGAGTLAVAGTVMDPGGMTGIGGKAAPTAAALGGGPRPAPPVTPKFMEEPYDIEGDMEPAIGEYGEALSPFIPIPIPCIGP